MVLGMSLEMFTFVHTIISLVRLRWVLPRWAA